MTTNTHHDRPLEVTATVVECNNWVDPDLQPCYVYMQYGDFKSLVIKLTSPVAVSGINPQFPPHFVFPLTKGLSELCVVVSRDPNFTLSAIIGSVRISLHNVMSHGSHENSWYLHKGSDHRCAGAITLKLLCANTNHGASSSRKTPQSTAGHPRYEYPPPPPPHGYPQSQVYDYPPPPPTHHPYRHTPPSPSPPGYPQPYNYYSPPLATPTYPSYGYPPPPQSHVYPQPRNYYSWYGYPPPPPPPSDHYHNYHPHQTYNYPPAAAAAQPPFLQGLLVTASLTQILDNLSNYFGGLGDF